MSTPSQWRSGEWLVTWLVAGPSGDGRGGEGEGGYPFPPPAVPVHPRRRVLLESSEAATARALVHWSLLVPPRHRQSSGGGRGGLPPHARGAGSEAAIARAERGARRRLRAWSEE